MGKYIAPGEVVRLRVSPKDCLTCIDICDAIGIRMTHMSFAQVVKIALASCLESMRQNQIVPTRSGFEFNDMMGQFRETGYTQHAAKLGVAKLINELGERISPKPLVPKSPELIEIERRMEELHIKREHDEVNWTPADQQEWEQLSARLFNDAQP